MPRRPQISHAISKQPLQARIVELTDLSFAGHLKSQKSQQSIYRWMPRSPQISHGIFKPPLQARIVEVTDLSFFVRKSGRWRSFDMPRFKKLTQHEGSTPLKASTKAVRKITTTPQKRSKFNLTRMLNSSVAKLIQ